jgi:hypothetical protein
MEPLSTPLPQPVPATRNLVVPLAQWLRTMGFAVLEHGWPAPTSLTATWQAPAAGPQAGACYTLDYCFVAGASALRLVRTTAAHPHHVDKLVDGAWVRRLREARYLLLSCQHYSLDRARALAAGTLQPTKSA